MTHVIRKFKVKETVSTSQLFKIIQKLEDLTLFKKKDNRKRVMTEREATEFHEHETNRLRRKTEIKQKQKTRAGKLNVENRARK